MKKTLLLKLLLVVISASALHAQASGASAPVAPVTIGQSVIALTGPWKFHIGDNPQWVDPSFDDSSWETVDLTTKAGSFDPTSGVPGFVPGWTAKGHPGYWGYAWYRIRVKVNAQPGQSLALAGPSDVDDAYEVFANGRLLGSFGKFPPNGKAPVVYNSQPMVFQLPQNSAEGSETLNLAVRIWMQPNTLLQSPDVGGFHDAPQLGDASMIAADHQLAWLEYIRSYGWGALEAALYFLLTLLTCSLILFDRSDRVYWWLAAEFLLTAVERTNLCLIAWSQVESLVTGTFSSDVLLRPAMLGIWVMVWWTWFRLRHPAWIPKFIALLTILYAIADALGEDLFFTLIPHPVSAEFHLASIGIRILFLPLLIYIVIEGVREQGWDGWLALPAVVLVSVAQFQFELAVLHVRTTWFPLGLQVTLSQVANLTLAAVIFVLLIRRLLLSIRQQRQLALDVKQAQEVQQVIIPAIPPATPGFEVETIYLPAQQVGGDFFQVLPAKDGSILIVIGDVSGKGLKAAMTVSAIVGALRNEKDRQPATVLANLNHVLRGQVTGFVTATAVLITADGAMTLANAGNLAPYHNGEELTIPSGLPLGIIAKNNYPETTCQLEPNDRLTFVSDGVVEAANEKNELFGFERTQSISSQPAATIAAAAQAFGQKDDISVLSVTVLSVPHEAVV
jgi:hypothetical protein